MDCYEILKQMRQMYQYKPIRWLKLPVPSWMHRDTALSRVYREKDTLLKNGRICFAYLVQANDRLFRILPQYDYPAAIIYSEDAFVQKNPWVMTGLARQLYSYKNKPILSVPKQWRSIASAITDEYDRSDYTVTVNIDGQNLTIHYLTMMVYRKYLPKRKLCGGMFPILAAPESCRSVLILPKRYWTKGFRDSWVSGEVL